MLKILEKSCFFYNRKFDDINLPVSLKLRHESSLKQIKRVYSVMVMIINIHRASERGQQQNQTGAFLLLSDQYEVCAFFIIL